MEKVKMSSVSVAQAADIFGVQKPHLFKIIKRLGIETHQEKSDSTGPHRGAKIAFISKEDFERLKEYLKDSHTENEPSSVGPSQGGVFYLIQLEPEHDPTRFKLGFASDVSSRLRQHKTAAPYSKVVGIWPCKQLWEKTAIESIARGCDRVHTEVFRGKSIEIVRERCEEFFALMPSID
ncbi:MAG: hypothetical protein OXN23_00625 [Gammaproteobacteria bacterium]|nr:hypothetical protein [Gammaproteobacteria bacterium]MDE0301933.1 hypothetical protein [Gammaproteobacteria bacterium]